MVWYVLLLRELNVDIVIVVKSLVSQANRATVVAIFTHVCNQVSQLVSQCGKIADESAAARSSDQLRITALEKVCMYVPS